MTRPALLPEDYIQCISSTTSGRRCKRNCTKGEPWCSSHSRKKVYYIQFQRRRGNVRKGGNKQNWRDWRIFSVYPLLFDYRSDAESFMKDCFTFENVAGHKLSAGIQSKWVLKPLPGSPRKRMPVRGDPRDVSYWTEFDWKHPNLVTASGPDPEDIFRWPDGDWCFRSEHETGEYSWKSDDFTVVPADLGLRV